MGPQVLAGPGLSPGPRAVQTRPAARCPSAGEDPAAGRRVRAASGGSGVQCSEPGLPSLQDLVNIEMFLTAKEVEESLERRETATCLAWCHDNKSRLRKMKVRGLRRGEAPGGAGRAWAELAESGGAAPAAPEPVVSELCGCIRPRCWVWCGFGVVI